MSMIEKLKAMFGGAGPGVEAMDGGMISCEEALALVHEFIDGELGEVPHTRAQAHFDVCQGCYPHLRLEGAFRDAVQRAAEGQGAPPDLKEKLLEALAEADD